MLSPAAYETVMTLASEAGPLAETARQRLGLPGGGPDHGSGGRGSTNDAHPTTDEMSAELASFHFPDDAWARTIYDLVLAAARPDAPIERLVAALVPIYFGRVGSFVIENRGLTTDQAEERVERQAREFELLKPYLIKHWNAAVETPSEPAIGGDGAGGPLPTGASTVDRS